MTTPLVKCSLMVATLLLGALHKAVPSELSWAAWLGLGALGLRLDRRLT